MNNKEKLSKRVKLRLKHYDYAQQGLYFITICYHQKKCLFGSISQEKMHLNDAGLMIEKWYKELENKFPTMLGNTMIVMPNHFHCIIEIKGVHTGSPLHEIIQWFKTMTTNEYIRNVKTKNWARFNDKLWQRNYHEHVIRNNDSHQKIIYYIQYNPAKWRDDKYYM
jgi:REP element-mobilizing transposase RayT